MKLDNVMGTQTIEEYAAFEIYLQQAQVFTYKWNIDFMIYELITILFICMNWSVWYMQNIKQIPSVQNQ